MKRFSCKSILLAIALVAASSCAKETKFDIPVGSWNSYMTEYYISGSSLDPYTSTKSAYYESVSFDASGKCSLTVGGIEREYDFTFDKNVITVGGSYAKFRIMQMTGMTLILAVDVEGDPNAKAVFEYKRDEELPIIYSNYTSFEGTENRCFWYMNGKKKVFCYPIIATTHGKEAFDEMCGKNTKLPFYDQIQFHFKKVK